MKRLVLYLLLATMGDASAQQPYVASNSPPDKPAYFDSQQVQSFEQAIQPYIAKAKLSYPQAKNRFESGLPAGQSFFIATRVSDASGKFEQVFVAVDQIKNGEIRGRIWSNVELVNGYRKGDSYSFPESSMIDWLITQPDGSEEGNYVGKFLDTYQQQPAVPSEKCGVIAKVDGKIALIVLSSFEVTRLTAQDVSFSLPASAPESSSGVMCARASIIPANNDFKVILAGYPFFIMGDDGRKSVMELINGKLQVRTLSGQFTATELPVLQAVLNTAQSRVNAAPARLESR